MNGKKRRPGGGTPGRQRKKRMQGEASTYPFNHYNTGGAGVQVEDALYELEKHSGPLVISHIDEAQRRKEIAARIGI